MKKINYILIFIMSFFLFTTNIYAENFELNSEKAILYNLNDNEVLFEKKSDVKTSIASLTKIMTAIVAIENIDDFDEVLTVKKEDLEGLSEAHASTAGYKEGDKATYEDLLYGLLLPSGADAANVLANNIAGSKKEFVELMNKYVDKLNLKNTHFANPTGLDDKDNYSTLEDLANIFKYALKNKEFKKVISTMEYKAKKSNLLFESTIKKTIDRFNIDMNYLIGGKTGTTDDAGLCLASIASYSGIDYMLITTNAPYKKPYNFHIVDAKTIYDYYIENYSYQPIVNKGDVLVNIKTKYSNPKNITFRSEKTIKKYLNNDFNINDIKYEYEGINELNPLNKKGDIIGHVNIIYNDEILDVIDIKLNSFIMLDLISYFTDNMVKCIIIILIISIVIFNLMPIRKKKRKKRKR